METIVRPLSWDGFPGPARELFRSFRTPGVGEQLILEENAFIEQALPGTVMTGLTDGVDRRNVTLETAGAINSPEVTHLHYRVTLR